MSKKFILLIMCIVFTINNLLADDTIRFAYLNYVPKIVSYEDTVLSGTMSIQLVIKFNDTTDFRNDFEIVIQDNFFEQIPPSLQGDTDIVTYYPGDSIIVDFNFAYDTASISFYPKTIEFVCISDTITRSATAVFYFTPFNTLEVWDVLDFNSLKRIWLLEKEEPETRQYISKNSIPVSNVPDSSFFGSVNEDYSIVFIEGLAYGIPMIIEDTNSICESNFLRQSYSFTIENTRIFSWHNNQQIWLKNATVEIYRKRSLLPALKLLECKTDDEGYFIYNSNRTFEVEYSSSSGGEIDVYFKVKLIDPEGNIIVKDLNVFIAPFIVSNIALTQVIKEKVGQIPPNKMIGDIIAVENDETISWGELEMGSFRGGKVFTWLQWAREFTNQELEDINSWLSKPVEVLLNWPHSMAPHLYYESLLLLESRVVEDEGTVFHEFGHSVMYELYGLPVSTLLNDLNLVWGYHSHKVNNKHPKMTVSEGFATGYALIMNEMTMHVTDHTSITENAHNGFQNIDYGTTFPQLDHPCLAESVFACIIHDLWDGPNNYGKYSHELDPYLSNVTDQGFDNFEFPFSLILKPLIDHPNINDMMEYLGYFAENLNCYDFRSFHQVVELNMSTNQTEPITEITLNTDLIFRNTTLSLRRFRHNIEWTIDDIISTNWADGDEFVFRENYNYTFKDNVNDFAHYEFNYNILSETIDFTVKLSDNIHLRNDVIFSLNKNNGFYGWEIDNVQQSSIQNSLLHVNTCALDFSFGSNSVNTPTLEIGDPYNYSNAILTIGNNSKLDLTLGGKIVINNNSKLIIDETSELIIGEGIIELEGENAVLEIRGNLVLADNAEFKPTGTGHVVFDVPPFWQVQCGTNASIEFSGSNSDDKVLEIKGNTVEIPGTFSNNPVESFTLKNGKVEMGEGAQLWVGVNNIEISNVKITNNPEGYHLYDGVTVTTNLGTQYILLKTINIENARNGLRLISPDKWKIQNLHIFNTENPLYTNGGGVIFDDLRIDGDPDITGNKFGTGWVAENMNYTSKLTDGFIKNTDGSGIYFHGTSASRLELKRADIEKNSDNGVFIYQSTLNAKCSKISDNGKFGVFSRKANIELSKDIGFAGVNDLSENVNSTVLVLLSKGLYVNNGFNDFHSTEDRDYDLMGTLWMNNPIPYRNLKANYNLWSNNDSPQNYLFNAYIWETSLYPINVITDQKINNFVYDEFYCPDAVLYDPDEDWWKHFSAACYIPDNYDFPLITTPAFNNVNLKDAIEISMIEMYNDTITGYLNASDRFSQILNYDYQSIDTVLREFLDLAYFKMLEAVGSALLSGQAEIDSANNYPIQFQNVLNVTSGLADSITISDTITYLRKFMYTYDLASLLRTFRQFDDAILRASTLMNWVETDEYDQANHLLCICNLEKTLRDSTTSMFVYDSLIRNACPYNYFPEETEPFIVLNTENPTEKRASDSGSNIITGNPVKDQLIISYPFEDGISSQAFIYDARGKLIDVKTVSTHSYEINVSQYPKGLYILKLSDGHVFISRKFIKE